MSVPVTRPITEHNQNTDAPQGTVMRSASPWFAPPVPSAMREPGTNYMTIITQPGPHDLERP